MTIDELLDMATFNLSLVEGAPDHSAIMRYAAIAKAAAATAQAMILKALVSHDGFQPAMRIVGDIVTQH